MGAPNTINFKIPRESLETGVADAPTFNAAMDLIDALLADGTAFGDKHWKGPVANFAALPVSVSNLVGDVRITLDTLQIWIWDGVAWQPGASGALTYKGVWDATNPPAGGNPTLADGVGDKGNYYVVGAAGIQNLGSGPIDFNPGDWVVYNGTIWQKADHTDVVTSVFGRQGVVVAQAGDYTHAQIAGVGENDHHNRQHDLSSALDHAGEITDFQHGKRGRGTLHGESTPDPGGESGFMSSADKQKLDGVAPGATNTPLTNNLPLDVTKAAASAGVAAEASRQDHKHNISTAAPGATSVAAAPSEGAATSLARSDHVHQSNTAPADITKAAATIGVSGEPARADHKHDVSTASAVDLTDATSSEGAATSLARSNHTHAHGNRGGGTLHPVVTPDPGGSAGFMSPADKAKSNLLMPPVTDAANAAPTEAVLIAASWVAGSYGFYRTTLNNKSWLVWYRAVGAVDYVQM